jgi:hypothetical protein
MCILITNLYVHFLTRMCILSLYVHSVTACAFCHCMCIPSLYVHSVTACAFRHCMCIVTAYHFLSGTLTCAFCHCLPLSIRHFLCARLLTFSCMCTFYQALPLLYSVTVYHCLSLSIRHFLEARISHKKRTQKQVPVLVKSLEWYGGNGGEDAGHTKTYRVLTYSLYSLYSLLTLPVISEADWLCSVLISQHGLQKGTTIILVVR